MDKRVFQVVGSPTNSVMNADGIYKFCSKGNGVLEWRIGEGDPYGNFIRLTEDRGWLLSWYDNPSKNKINPPSQGWRFNGGKSKPKDLGNNIRIIDISTKMVVPKIEKKNSPSTPKTRVRFKRLNKFSPLKKMIKLVRKNTTSTNLYK